MVTDYAYYAATTRLGSILTQKGSNVFQIRTYGYTYAGNISSISDVITNNTYTYGYDNAGRLDWEKTNGIISVDMTYDLAGNVDYKTMGANTIDPAYETGRKNVIEGVTFNGNYYEFDHDDNGNMTLGNDFTNPLLIGERRITYNADNMPTQIDYTPLGGSMLRTEIKYDGNGARVKKTVGSDTTYYFGDHFEIKNSTPMIYIFAGNMRVAQRENGTVAYFHKDHLGSSTVMTDENGNKIGGMEYYPFGGQRNPGDTIPTHYRFTDQELDGGTGESGLYNYGARLYDPIIGRFISADPIVPHPFNPQSLNRYSYCLNNPLIYVDPSGYEDEDKDEFLCPEIIVTPTSEVGGTIDINEDCRPYTELVPTNLVEIHPNDIKISSNWDQDPWKGRISGDALDRWLRDMGGGVGYNNPNLVGLLAGPHLAWLNTIAGSAGTGMTHTSGSFRLTYQGKFNPHRYLPSFSRPNGWTGGGIFRVKTYSFVKYGSKIARYSLALSLVFGGIDIYTGIRQDHGFGYHAGLATAKMIGGIVGGFGGSFGGAALGAPVGGIGAVPGGIIGGVGGTILGVKGAELLYNVVYREYFCD